jgi:hypothetical protein
MDSLAGNFPTEERVLVSIEKEFGLAPEPAMKLQKREKSYSSAANWKTFTLKF